MGRLDWCSVRGRVTKLPPVASWRSGYTRAVLSQRYPQAVDARGLARFLLGPPKADGPALPDKALYPLQLVTM